MNYYERMYRFYEKIVGKEADSLARVAVDKVIERLKSITPDNSDFMQSGDDNSIANLWEEICVQVQGEKSFFWEAYEDFIYSCISEIIPDTYTDNQLDILWFKTKEYEEWRGCEFDEEEELERCFYKEIYPEGIGYIEDIKNMLYLEILQSAADEDLE